MAEQEKTSRIAAFSFSFGACDAEAAEWFLKQPNKGAYLKSLILADKELCQNNEPDAKIVPKPNNDEQIWESHFALLKEFKEQHGRLPAYSESYKGFRLGRWLHDTARRARISRPDRLEKLHSIGIVDKWERNLALVERFKGLYNRLPAKEETFEGIHIGAWLNVQTARLRNEPDAFSEEQIKKMRGLGICASDWDKKYSMLEAFKAEHNRLPKYSECYGDVKLGRWLAYQRKTLDPIKHLDRVKRFEQLGALPYPLPKKQQKQLKNKA